jgi:hypothetical protein
MSPPDLRVIVSDSSAAPLVDVILLSDDLRQRQAIVAGELAHAVAAVLEPAQIAGQATLPDFLTREETGEALSPSVDRLWGNYWHHAAAVARRRGSTFLRGWVGLEVALRNGVAVARARSFSQPAAAHLVAPELGENEQLIELGIAGWAGAADPLAGLRSLLRTRWEWATREEPSFSFSDDELAAYAVKLLLLRDWRRTMGVAA